MQNCTFGQNGEGAKERKTKRGKEKRQRRDQARAPHEDFASRRGRESPLFFILLPIRGRDLSSLSHVAGANHCFCNFMIPEAYVFEGTTLRKLPCRAREVILASEKSAPKGS